MGHKLIKRSFCKDAKKVATFFLNCRVRKIVLLLEPEPLRVIWSNFFTLMRVVYLNYPNFSSAFSLPSMHQFFRLSESRILVFFLRRSNYTGFFPTRKLRSFSNVAQLLISNWLSTLLSAFIDLLAATFLVLCTFQLRLFHSLIKNIKVSGDR